jgi:hypothetical protein
MRLYSIKKTALQHRKKLLGWQKIFSSYSLDKRLISRMYKELKKLKTKREIQIIN